MPDACQTGYQVYRGSLALPSHLSGHPMARLTRISSFAGMIAGTFEEKLLC